VADTVKTVSLLRDAQNATPSLQAINDSGVFEALESTSGALKVIMDAITDVKITLADGLTELPVKFLTAQDIMLNHKASSGQTITINSSASVSSSFSVDGIESFGVGVPYGTEGVNLALWVSIDDTNWFLLPEVMPFVADQEGVNYACNTAGVGLMELLAPWKYCKIQTLDGEGAAQVQTSNRDLTVVMR